METQFTAAKILMLAITIHRQLSTMVAVGFAMRLMSLWLSFRNVVAIALQRPFSYSIVVSPLMCRLLSFRNVVAIAPRRPCSYSIVARLAIMAQTPVLLFGDSF